MKTTLDHRKNAKDSAEAAKKSVQTLRQAADSLVNKVKSITPTFYEQIQEAYDHEEAQKIASFICDQQNRFFYNATATVWSSFQCVEHPEDFGLTEYSEAWYKHMVSLVPTLKKSPLAPNFKDIEDRVSSESKRLGVKKETEQVLLKHFFSLFQALAAEYDSLYDKTVDQLKTALDHLKKAEESSVAIKTSLETLHQKEKDILRKLDLIEPTFYEHVQRVQ